jgi:Flp pilus assembly protein TadG
MDVRRFGNSFKRRFLKNQRGQAAVVVMITASTMMALAAASVETGHVYYAYQKLVASTNASVMAGASQMPNTTSASTYVTKYSSGSGDYNATPMLTNAVATPKYLCLNTVTSTLNVPCSTSSGGTGGYNSL